MKKWKKYLTYRAIILWAGICTLCVVDCVFKLIALHHGRILPVWFAISLLCTLGIVGYGMRYILRPYLQHERTLHRFLDGRLVDYTSDCMVHLSPRSEQTVTKLDQTLHSPEMFELNKRQAQYLALQNQINPHFLYNTLESIRSEAVIAQLDSVADMTESLATFFRYTISKVENLVSVEEELENCKTYFHIQKYRFGNRLELHIDCNQADWQDIRYLRMPKLTLQPILENSIIHGTELKLGTSHLTVQFTCTESRLLIRISDDGVGMDSATLQELNQNLYRNTQHKDRGGIALANVNHRIHLLFGEAYGVHIYSVAGVGTDVEISLPLVHTDTVIRSLQTEQMHEEVR